MLSYNNLNAQDYTWTGATDSNFYNTANWTSSAGPVLFDNGGFRVARTNAAGNSPVINQFIDWQPGIFDHIGGNLTVNADFNVFFNDKLNGSITVNTGAIFTCRNIFRVGREGAGTVNINGGTFRCNNADTWQGIFIGALTGGNGTVNVNAGGTIDGGYQVEVGTRNNYPTGLLNVNSGGISQAYWATVVGPNGTVNVNGGTINAGQALIVGDLYVDNPGTEGTVGATVGTLNINSGSVTVNQNDLASPALNLNANAKVRIDNGSLIIKRTGTDFSSIVNGYVSGGQIVSAAGKQIVVSYNGVLTTVTAQSNMALTAFDEAQVFDISPNPAQDFITIRTKNDSNATLNVSIIALSGAEIMKQSIQAFSGNYTLDIKNKLAAGMYLIKIDSEKGVYSSKIIVK